MPRAIVRSAALRDAGREGGGNRKLRTATSSPPTFMRVTRRPEGVGGAERGGLGLRERGTPSSLAGEAVVASLPVTAHPRMAAAGSLPVSGDVARIGAWRSFVVASVPRVPPAVPAVRAGDPDMVGTRGRWWRRFDLRGWRRRRLLDDHLTLRGRGSGSHDLRGRRRRNCLLWLRRQWGRRRRLDVTSAQRSDDSERARESANVSKVHLRLPFPGGESINPCSNRAARRRPAWGSCS